MKKLKTIALPLAMAAAAVGLSTPASAQDWRNGGYHGNANSWRMTPQANATIRDDINQLRRTVDRGDRRGRLSPREWRGLRGDVANLQRLYSSYARNGLSRTEVSTLEYRINAVRTRLQMERRDYDGRRG